MNIIKKNVITILQKAIFDLYQINLEKINIETPPKKELWDFCFWPFLLSKKLAKNPALISNELKDFLLNKDFREISVAWPYLNFKLSFEFYTKIFFNEKIKSKNIWNGKTIIVDYIWTNIWKAMHIWHMCSSNQWQITCNLYRFLWYNVIWDSHLWDWWIIFWKLILSYKLWWDEKLLKSWAVDYLQSLYIKITTEIEKNPDLEEQIRQEFKKLSLWDKESIKLWELFTKYSLDNVQIQNDRLWVKATYDIWESFYEWIWLPKLWNYPDLKYKMSDIIKELIQKWIAIKNDDNSVWIIFDEKTKLPSVMLQKRDGTHWYLASDLAAVKYRIINWNPDKIIYHTDFRQELHFKQVFEIASKAGWIKTCELFHAINWFISLKSWAMSSRKWNIIKLDTLLDEGVKRAKDILLQKNPEISQSELDKISQIIWIWAIKYGYLSKSRITDVVFDWDEFMTFEWNSFPYVAYSYVRALRILEKSWFSEEEIKNNKINSNFYKNEQINIFKEISSLEEILYSVWENLFSHILVWYVYNLSKSFSVFYSSVWVLNEENIDKKLLNLKLINSYIQTLKIIFDILAIKLPTKM